MDTLYLHSEKEHNLRAPLKVVPLLQKLFQPTSVLDVGCGIGTWLHAFEKNGISDVVGLDGTYVDKALLAKYIAVQKFIATDLMKPFQLNRKFDLAISLEVAEHLPENCAQQFVDCITEHADVVVFSAAIPGQSGQNHLNEQWPSYWAALFEQKGFFGYDLLRPLIWDIPEVDVWYKQNMLVYTNQPIAYKKADMLNVIHPDLFTRKHNNLLNASKQLQRISNGKVGIWYPIKSGIKSLRYLGFKQP